MINLLNLRKEPQPSVVIVTKPRSFLIESLKMLVVISVVTATVWGISKADIQLGTSSVKNWSAVGTVLDISSSTLSLTDAHASDATGDITYDLDLGSVKKIENRTYIPLQLSDINVGDKVVVQGIEDNNTITIRRIISFSNTATTTDVTPATSTATSTDVVATSTDSSATSTTATSTTATSTDSTTTGGSLTIASTTDATATSTDSSATSTDTTASSTQSVATTTNPVATTTPDMGSTTLVIVPDPVVTPPAPVAPTPTDPATVDTTAASTN